MLSFKYSFDEVYDRPLLPVRVKEGKRSWSTTAVILPIFFVIGMILLFYSPVKAVQLIIEKFSD